MPPNRVVRYRPYGVSNYQVARAAANALTRGYRAYKSYRSSNKSNSAQQNTQNYQGVTAQHDFTNVYTKKRMPRRKRRAWKRFSKKALAVDLKATASQTGVMNSAGTWSNAVNYQTYGCFWIYGRDGTDLTGDVGNADLTTIFSSYRDETNISGQATSKIYFQTAVLDLTLTNTGTVSEEVDLYHIKFWDEVKNVNFSDMQNVAASNTPILAGSLAAAIDLRTRGVTPFDMPMLIRRGKVKIISKKKYFVPAGASITRQLRSPKNWSTTKDQVTNNDTVLTPDGFVMPGRTEGILVVRKPVAGYAATANPMSYGVTRKYMWKVLPKSDQRAGGF